MIIEVKKYLFIGAKEDLDHFFYRAQQQGFIEFIPSGDKGKGFELPHEIQSLTSALKVLRKLPPKGPYHGELDLQLAVHIASEILTLKAEVEKFSEERRLIEAEITRVAPFGDFSMDDIDYIEKATDRKVQFFCMKTARSAQADTSPDLIYVSTNYDLDYYLALSFEPLNLPHMIEMRIDRPLGELEDQLALVKETLHVKESELKERAIYLLLLQEALIDYLNHFHLSSAKKEVIFPLKNALFAIEAWVPQNKVTALFGQLSGMAVHAEQIGVEEFDRIPTYMENKGSGKIGEDLVHVYDVPSTTDKDPSKWVLGSFALFFSMIVADAGYGLLYLTLAFYLKWKFPQLKGQAKRLVKLFAILAASCIVWGVVTSSYFGLNIGLENPLGRVSLLRYVAEKKADYHLLVKDDVYAAWKKEIPAVATAQTGAEFLQKGIKTQGGDIKYEILGEFTDNVLLEWSLLAGLIHISLAFVRYMRRNLAGLGWICFMIGGYLHFPSILGSTNMFQFLGLISKETSSVVGVQMLYVGIGSALLLAAWQKKSKGLAEVANLVSVFADVLSYLRLYALALASSVMASTFNQQGEVIGFAIGTLVILAGHGVNLVLGTMSGVIHGLRLNFIEWYHFCFEGGGRLFNPLKRIKH